MMSEANGRSLKDRERGNSIFHHLFLPQHLPSSEHEDFLLKSSHENEHELLEYFLPFFTSFENQSEVSTIFIELKKCLQRWVEIQNAKNVSSSNFQISFQRLTTGDFLPLYFHNQNASILIEIDEEGPSQPLVSAWQVLLPIETITSSIHRHFSLFPERKFRLEETNFLHSSINCELLVDFYKNPIEYLKTNKASYRFDETRNVPLSHYVCQWWLMLLEGTEEKKDKFQFRKKHRDHIRFCNAFSPFRRSGLWMTIKVVFQTILMKRFGTMGRIFYKLLITSLLIFVVENEHFSSPEFFLFALRKIVRRMNKIDAIDSTTTLEAIEFLKNNIRSKLEPLLSKFRQSEAVELTKTSTNFQCDLNQSGIYQHTIQSTNVSSSSTSMFGYSSSWSWTSTSTLSSSRSIDSTDLSIIEKELWFESKLRSCLTGSSESFVELLKKFEEYQNLALSRYCSTSSSDPMGYSRFVLIALEVLWMMHQKLCSDSRFQLLRDYAIVIANLFELFQFLALPDRTQMIRARFLYDYFDKLKNKSFRNFLTNVTSADSFSVRFAQQSASMQTTLKEIRDEAERDKQAKIREVEVAQQKYKNLIEEAEKLECQCKDFAYGRKCDKCSKMSAANQLSVSIYECPIPNDEEEALVVVFELQMPVEIRCFREILFQFINRPTPNKSESNTNEWLQISPHQMKLRRFYACPFSPKVKLISSEKSISQTHYSSPRKIASTDVEGFLFDNSLRVQISSTQRTSFETEREILTAKLTESKYQHLQETLKNTDFQQNKVIAQLSKCSRDLHLNQHIEFGSFRSGHCLQW